MLVLSGFVSGLIATIIFDIFNFSLNLAYGVDKPKWNLLGRYFLGYKNGHFIRKSLKDDYEIEGEFFWGYIFHYTIGVIFGLIYVFLNYLFFDYPSILVAYLFGFITVLCSWCFLMPFAYNLGFFASKSHRRFEILTQNLIAHFVFGTGLFIGLYTIV
tara:strand:- start:102 stop:575 length:474 start_codon:yes stop_codon:yes gene_type:complete